MTDAPLLLVDDDAAFRKVYGGLLRELGLTVEEAGTRPAAREALQRRPFRLVLLDLMLPPDGTVEAGLRQLEEILSQRPTAKVIAVSGAGDTSNALQAVRSGAYDFLTKPVDPDVLQIVVQRALARVALEEQVAALQVSLKEARPRGAMLGEAPAFEAARELAEKIAASDLPVLITGENGTGKELLARSIHQESRRSAGPFVAVNCGALSENLLESALFGHVKGAFTGAVRDHRGLFTEADGGTLFLDEVGDMPPPLQVKVLRALDYGEILPVGAEGPSRVDVRLVSATNKDLAAMLGAGTFREDLYWRIKGAQISLPPLRARVSDLALLAQHFLNEAAHLNPSGRPRHLSAQALDALQAHAWPGNLRELRHEMQRASVIAGTRVELEPEDFSFSAAERAPPPAPGKTSLSDKVEALERAEIARALQQHQGNRTHAAQALGLSRQGLLKKLERYGLA